MKYLIINIFTPEFICSGQYCNQHKFNIKNQRNEKVNDFRDGRGAWRHEHCM